MGETKMKFNRILTGIFTAGLVLSSFAAQAAEEKDIAELEKQLIKAETDLLVPELRLDKLQQDRSKYDGASGWFQGSKKKALDAEIAKNSTLVDQQYTEMRSVSEQVQKMVFSVAQTFEKHGQYQKAIEYYLKVENRTDSVRERVAACYKAVNDFQQAIKWLLEMQRTDNVLLEVVDCCKLDNGMKEAVYWLFEILKPWAGNTAELTALELIEKYDYPQRKLDYPDFFRRLSDVYIAKALDGHAANFIQAAKDYRKAVELLAGDLNETPAMVSFSIVDRQHNNYSAAIEILERQKEAAERNFEDKVRQARSNVENAEDRLDRAHRDAERDYDQRLRTAEDNARRAADRLNQLKAITTTTPDEIARAQASLDQANRDREHIRRNRESIIRDYLRPYENEVEEARRDYDRLIASHSSYIEEYVAPYKRQVSEAKKAYDLIKTLHDANYK